LAKLLVTGGAGFIGGNFVHYWRARHPGDEITVLDALTETGNAERIGDVAGVSLIVGDVGDAPLVETLLRARQIDTIVHFAADATASGTHCLFQAAETVWLDEDGGRRHRFHHAASGYGPAEAGAAEDLVRVWHRDHGLHATGSSCANNYGPYQLPDRLIPLFLANALSNKRLPVHGEGWHDWLHVEDHCRGVELALERGEAGETYRFGGGAEMSDLELVEQLCGWLDRAFAADPQLAKRFPFAPPARGEQTVILKHFIEDDAGQDRRCAIDASKARDELGYVPARSFGEGLGQTLQWYLDNEEWWLPLLERNK
jgi:dTDP-glucose 4,6-dehydratase